MSQQEFFQGSQSQEQRPFDEEIIEYPQQPYYWSSKPNAPKEEHVLHYDGPMVQDDYQNGYMAQNAGYAHSTTANAAGSQFSKFKAQSQSQKQERQQRFSPDGDAFEQQYRPYNRAQWSVPPWAQPQKQNRRWSKIALLIVLALLLIKPLLILFAIFGVLLLAVVIPLVMIGFVLLIPFGLVFLVSLPYLLARGITGRSSPQRRWRYTDYWRVSSNPWRRRW